MTMEPKGKQFLIGAAVGGVLGAVTALLLAPKSGRELRSDIKNQAQAVSEKTQQVAEAISQKTQEVAQTVGEHTAEWYEKAKEATVHVVDGVRSWKESKADVIEYDDSVSEAAEDVVILGNR